MKRIIINADDCGISSKVNDAIEEAILLNKITSTTIMANMDNFEGAIKLYKKYKDIVSFGWHMNLTEGEPLTKSQLLLDKGFFIERNGNILLNGMEFRNKRLNKSMQVDIKKELRTQWEKLKDSGVQISHADSHQYIHTSPSLGFLIPSLFKELEIKKCRCIANYGKQGFDSIIRKLWAGWFKMNGMIMPDTFCFFKDYYNSPYRKQGEVIELMIHPGHRNPLYNEEWNLLKNADLRKFDAELISYNEF